MSRRMSRMISIFIVAAALVGIGASACASHRVAATVLSHFDPLSPDDLDGLDGMGGSYLDSLPEGVLQQLSQMENLRRLDLDIEVTKQSKIQFGLAGVWDKAFQNARGIMALIQLAGDHNVVNMHLNVNV